MKTIQRTLTLLGVLSIAPAIAFTQTQNTGDSASSSGVTAADPVKFTPPPVLQQIDQAAQTAAQDISQLQIDKWKADSVVKQQAKANADSISRNISSALPSLTAAVRTSPQDFVASFKLYRDLNALHDVFQKLVQASETSGQQRDFEALNKNMGAMDACRRQLGEYLESLVAAKDSELMRLRAAAQRPAPVVPVKKVVVDNTPDKPQPKKKR